MMGIKNRSFGPLLLVTLVQTGTGPSVASRHACSWSHTATILPMAPQTAPASYLKAHHAAGRTPKTDPTP